MKKRPIEALDIVALQIEANSKAGTPKHAKAVRILEAAKEQWFAKFKKCPHCGK